ncbi:MAG: methylated-DNA--[protein]-cysteine S-methyltransferase [Solirubrobacterales bacterium]|nr:methylated-DNA--[protein]-cysteine S-methyltransferase [Solirubrobacterales bacterium]
MNEIEPNPEGGQDSATHFPVAGAELTALQSRLSTGAEAAGLLDVAYRTIDSPIGPLLLAATDRGLVRIGFECEGFDAVLAGLAAELSPRILKAPARLDVAATELEQYFNGNRRGFDLALDHSLSSGFRLEVQRYLPRIGYGQTLSYREVAELVGNPKASRAVGTACATNPLPVVVPCHRVLRSDGSLGGYAGGLDLKTALLALERPSG